MELSSKLRLALVAIVATLAIDSSRAQGLEALCEPPRLGVVLKGGGASAKTHVEALGDSLRSIGVYVEIEKLESLPSKAQDAPTRYVLVIEKATATQSGAITHEYASKDTKRSGRIRFRGASAEARGTLHVFGPDRQQVAEFVEEIDRTRAPYGDTFAPDESKKEITISPSEVLGEVIDCLARRALAFSAGLEMWPLRSELESFAEKLDGERRAAFWARASLAAYEPSLWKRTIFPWRTLERAAITAWRNASGETASTNHPAESCAWCGAKPSETGECRCPGSRALESARSLMRCTILRSEFHADRGAASLMPVSMKALLPARPGDAGDEINKLERRLSAEHAADVSHLRNELASKPQKSTPLNYDWHVLITLDGPVEWSPNDPDLVRHAARTIVASKVRSHAAVERFKIAASVPMIVLLRAGEEHGEFKPLEKREMPTANPELIESFLEKALWGNARGTPKAP